MSDLVSPGTRAPETFQDTPASGTEVGQRDRSLAADVDAVSAAQSRLVDSGRIHGVYIGSVCGIAVDDHYFVIDGDNPCMFLGNRFIGSHDRAFCRVPPDHHTSFGNGKAIAV